MKKFLNKKVAAVVLAAVVALGIGVSAAPANAYPGNVARNTSTGWVNVILDNGSSVWLAGYGAKVSNANWLRVWAGSCVSMNLTKYCAPYGTYDVRFPLRASINTVNRLS